MVVGYGPNEGNGEERERFWNDLGRTVDRIGNGHRLRMLGELNGWIGDRVRSSITGAFGVPGEKDNGRRLCLSNTNLKHKGGKEPRWSGDIEHDRSGAGEE